MAKPTKDTGESRRRKRKRRDSWDDDTAVTEMKELYKSFGDEAKEKLRELERSTDDIPSLVPGTYHQASGETVVVHPRRRAK